MMVWAYPASVESLAKYAGWKGYLVEVEDNGIYTMSPEELCEAIDGSGMSYGYGIGPDFGGSDQELLFKGPQQVTTGFRTRKILKKI